LLNTQPKTLDEKIEYKTIAKYTIGLLNTYMTTITCKINSLDTSHINKQIRGNHKFLFQQGVLWFPPQVP